MTEEQKAQEWEALSPVEKDRQIAEHRAGLLHFGYCVRCHHRIEALPKDFPTVCPNCGLSK